MEKNVVIGLLSWSNLLQITINFRTFSMLHCEVDLTQANSNVFNFLSDSSQQFWCLWKHFLVYKKCRGFGMDHQFNLQIIQIHTYTHACARTHKWTQSRAHAVHVSTHKFAHTHTKTFFAYLSPLLYFYLFLYASLYLVFISLHLREAAYEILIMMHYQDYVLSLLTSPVCVHMCLSWGLCSAC